MSYSFFMPNVSIMGEGALNDASAEIAKLGFKKALVVTDKVLVKVGLVAKITNVLDKIGVSYLIYDEPKPNPTVKNVNDGLQILKDNGCDFVISVGGGSPQDAAKGIALLATNGGEIKDYEGFMKSKKPQLPIIAINTTAGTASEMTMFAVITDEVRKVKMVIADKHITTTIAVNDPSLMVDMPKSLTAATGMDALTHSVEAYVANGHTPVTDACAVGAVKLIFQYLKKAVDDGHDLEARDKMAYAEYLAGMAFNSAGLGYVHSMAHQLGGFYDLPHGVCNAVLLPHVEEFNKATSADRMKELAEAVQFDVKGLSDNDGANVLLSKIRELSCSVGIPAGLKELGVLEADFPTLADNAMKDACAPANPRKPSKDDVIRIYKNAF